MKPKNFILIILLVAIIGIGIWWFARPTMAVPEKIVETLKSAKADVQPVMSPTITLSIVSPVAPITPKPDGAPVAAKQLIATPPPDPNTASIAELKTAFADMGRLIRDGDMVQFYETYRLPGEFSPEDKQKEQEIQDRNKIVQDPQNKIIQEEFAEAMEALAEQTPTFNDAGDEATYLYTAPTLPGQQVPDTLHPVTFVKNNGKWYIKPGN